MSSEQPRRAREAGGSGGSPIGSTAAIIIAVVAVVGGFFILRQINSDDSGSGTTGPGITASGTTLAPGGTTPGGVVTTLDPTLTLTPDTTLPITPTTPAAVTAGATVVVANASTVDGAAKRFTLALKAKNFTTGDGVTASVKLPVSVVYYDQADATGASLSVATYLASLLGGISVEPLPSPAPVKGGTLGTGVTVLLMLGSDKADKTLEQAGAPTTSTIATAGGTPTTPTTAAP